MTKTAFLQFGPWGGPYQTVKADDTKETKCPVNRSASGYGSKLATIYMIKYDGIWRRVYAVIWSNAGTLYVFVKGERIVVDFEF